MSARFPHFLLPALLLGLWPAFACAEPDASAHAAQDAGTLESRQILGWLENIRVYPGGMLMKAKLDSGARSNTIHAENIETFERDGVPMVRFSLLRHHHDPQSRRIDYELPLEGEVNIKQRNTPESDARPMVMLEFCLAGKRHTAPFSLTTRSGFNYPVLLGREFLKDHILVDPAHSFTHRTRCYKRT